MTAGDGLTMLCSGAGALLISPQPGACACCGRAAFIFVNRYGRSCCIGCSGSAEQMEERSVTGLAPGAGAASHA